MVYLRECELPLKPKPTGLLGQKGHGVGPGGLLVARRAARGSGDEQLPIINNYGNFYFVCYQHVRPSTRCRDSQTTTCGVFCWRLAGRFGLACLDVDYHAFWFRWRIAGCAGNYHGHLDMRASVQSACELGV